MDWWLLLVGWLGFSGKLHILFNSYSGHEMDGWMDGNVQLD